jgi:hypothetical protein
MCRAPLPLTRSSAARAAGDASTKSTQDAALSSHARAGQPTRRPVRKLFTLGGRIAWGAAGSIGLQQSLREELAAREREIARMADPREALLDTVLPLQQRALHDWVAHPGAPAPELACVFAWCAAGGEPRIFTIARTGADHQLHDRYAAVGTGDVFADFAMASAAHLRTPDLPLAQATLLALRIVADAVHVAAVYLGPPIQAHVVTPAGARPVARGRVDRALARDLERWKAGERKALRRVRPGSVLTDDGACAAPGGRSAPRRATGRTPAAPQAGSGARSSSARRRSSDGSRSSARASRTMFE